jgi:hypothetical protein
MRKSLMITVVGLLVVFATVLTSTAYSQTAPASTDAGKSQPKAKVVFHYGRALGLKNCLEQPAIQIDGVTVHNIFLWHVWEIDFTPGTHVISDDSHKGKGLTASWAPGQTYYYEMEWWKGFGFPKCENFWIRFEEAKPKEIGKVTAMLGKAGVDETTVTPAAAASVAAEAPKDMGVKLSIVSNPDAADIEVDGSFVGNTPSAIDLPIGEHSVIISKKGFEPWKRTIKLAAGDIKLNAELEKTVAAY